MKNKLQKAVIAVGGVFICAGLIISVIGADNGGSFTRALKSSGIIMSLDFKSGQTGKDDNIYDPYSNGGNYRSSGSMDDEMRDFFREFGMSDDDIDMFINPYGNDRSGGYPIQ